MKELPYARQSVSRRDIRAVTRVLKADYLTQGPKVTELESALSEFTGARHSVAMNSATSALHLACLALGVGQGDLVWTSSISFVASANCAKFCGADVDFVDIDERTFNMCTKSLRRKLENARQLRRLPKAVIPVHFGGQPCDMKTIYDLSREFGFKVIEDASHAIGASYLGNKVGACEFSDITVFSFHAVKVITTGEGGAAMTNSSQLADKLRSLRSHGITREPNLMNRVNPPAWYYEQQELGFNYRMTDIQAALGLSQLKRLRVFVESRRKLAQRYSSKFRVLGVRSQEQTAEVLSSWHLYVIRVEADSRDEIFEFLRSHGILVNMHYLPIYRQPYYEQFNYDLGEFPNAEKYYREAITIPLFPAMSTKNQNLVLKLVGKALFRIEP